MDFGVGAFGVTYEESWRKIVSEVKDGAKREKNSNTRTFNSHEFAMPLGRQITPGETRAQSRHSIRAHLQIKSSTRFVREKLRKQQWSKL